MDRFTVPAHGGRGVSVRTGDKGSCVQLGIVSTRGNVMEAATVDLADVPALIGALRRAKEKADVDLLAALKQKEAEASERYKAALARNPWLNGEKSVDPDATYIVRPR